METTLTNNLKSERAKFCTSFFSPVTQLSSCAYELIICLQCSLISFPNILHIISTVMHYQVFFNRFMILGNSLFLCFFEIKYSGGL